MLFILSLYEYYIIFSKNYIGNCRVSYNRMSVYLQFNQFYIIIYNFFLKFFN